jgi:hypothetical protein
MTFNAHSLVGKSYVFEDGAKIEVIQVKDTDEDRGDKLVTFHVTIGPSVPRKQVMAINEFMEHYSHLFDIDTD